MSMFDPSKLDLDLENLDQHKSKVPQKETIKQTEEQTLPEKNTSSTGDKSKQESLPETSQKIEKSEISDNQTNKDSETTQEVIIDPLLHIEDNSDKYKNDSEKLYNKKDVAQKAQEENMQQELQKEKIIYDINISSLGDILNILLSEKYDFVTIEPLDEYIQINFRKDKVIKEQRNIKFPIYNQILIKTKSIARLQLDTTDKSQEGNGEVTIQSTAYKLLCKTVPSTFGEKAFIKLEEIKKKTVAKQKKKVSTTQLLWFLWAALFSSLVIGWAFLAFVLFNSNSVSDLTFFNNLGINVGSVKEFTAKLVDFIFSAILIIESIFLFIFIFKALLTKKEFKQKKIGRVILATFFLILTIISAFIWLTLSNKINTLKSANYWEISFFDNAKYLSPMFDEKGSVINVQNRIIGPVTIRFDIEEFILKMVDEGFQPQALTWSIDDETIEKPVQDYELIHTFDSIDLHKVILEIEGLNLKSELETREIPVADINISNIVNIQEISIDSWGSYFEFDASNLSNLWKTQWYYIPDLTNKDENESTQIIADALERPILEWEQFTSDPIFNKEVIIGMKIVNKNVENNSLDKIFILKKSNNENISWEIAYTQSLLNDLEYTLNFSNPETIFWNGQIERFIWEIEDQTFTRTADLTNLEESSQIIHEFEKYGSNKVKLLVIDSRGQEEAFNITIDIPKNLRLIKKLEISNEFWVMDDVEYDEKLKEYFLNEIWIPTKLKFDAGGITSNEPLYKIKEVEWDFNSDGDIDDKGTLVYHDLFAEGNHTITAHYIFEHRKLKDTLTMTEKIYIEAIKKDAILNIDIKKESNYVPITVRFDASKSHVNNENIVKFIWDYGDGITESRDAIVPGHKYTQPGDYNIKLKVITERGNEYETSKKLILQPRPQTVKITSSMKSAPTYQGIDFLSAESEGQIIGYFWDFWDWNTSTQANPTHRYTKAWKYTVRLRLDFANNNVLEDTLKIEIYEE